MIFEKLTLKNFRQFRGVQKLEFIGSDPKKNISIVFGENGRGKTGIFRAIMFALYGDCSLSQDQQIDAKEIFLVNSAELHKKKNGGEVVECFVEVQFSHKEEHFTLKRNRNGILEKGEVFEEEGNAELIITRKGGASEVVSEKEEIAQKINEILDRRVREYFLFDGEKIEKLTRASPEQRKEIAIGIRNLLNIDSLEKAKNGLKQLEKRLSKEASSNASSEVAKLINAINSLKEKRDDIENSITHLESEFATAEKQKSDVDEELSKIKEILDLLKERANLESLISEEAQDLGKFLEEIKAKVGPTAILLIKDSLGEVFTVIEEKRKRGEIPSEIRKDFIERLIQEGKCICGRPLEANSDCYNQIVWFKNKSNDLEIEDSILDLWRQLSTVNEKLETIDSDAHHLLQKFGVQTNKLEKSRRLLEDINKQIGDSNRPDALNLEKHRQEIDRKIGKLQEKLTQQNDELVAIKEDISNKTKEKEAKQKEEGIQNEIIQRADWVSKTRDALEKIYEEFTVEIKDVIGKRASEFFQEFIDEEGRKNLSQIVVNKDYSLQILNQWGNPFLANISAGQRQIMSISFIAALAQIAKREEPFEMPLFMDTPFGRLSFGHRKNLIEKIPDFTSQWILLATDTEFRRPEACLLKSGQRWHKFYILRGTDPGETKIEEVPLSKVPSLLHDYSGDQE